MAQITEDYCSFETAKLLKEKGFPQEYDVFHAMAYNEEDYEDTYEVQRMVLATRLVKAGTLSSCPLNVPEPKCYCPTLYVAMKWLRKVHSIIIEPYYQSSTWCAIVQIGNPLGRRAGSVRIYATNDFNSYEEACEAAIKYCLENLI